MSCMKLDSSDCVGRSQSIKYCCADRLRSCYRSLYGTSGPFECGALSFEGCVTIGTALCNVIRLVQLRLHFLSFPRPTPSPVISLEHREILHNALRVDQSGGITANWIYRGQVTVLGCDPRLGPLMQVSHLETAIQPLSIHLIWRKQCETKRSDIWKHR